MLYSAQRPRFLTGLNSSSSSPSPPSSYTLAAILSNNANNNSSAVALLPAVQSSFSPTYTQDYVVDETPYPKENDQRPSIMTMAPDPRLELVHHYMVNVMKIQYMQADQSIGPFIYEMIEGSTPARDAVCLLSSLHRHCVRDNYVVSISGGTTALISSVNGTNTFYYRLALAVRPVVRRGRGDGWVAHSLQLLVLWRTW